MNPKIGRYFGVNTSLYNTLPPEHIEALERSIYSTTIGDFRTAHSIFKNELSSCQIVPVVAIERADLALLQGRYKEVWETLDKCLRDLPLENSNPEDSSYRLMKIFHALATMMHKGTLEPAKEEIRHIRKWLANTPVCAYTDVQVNIIRKYVLVSLYVTLYSDNDEYETSLIPKPEDSKIPWQGLTDLRVSLLKRSMVFEALALFRVERNRIPHAERVAATSSFMLSLPSCYVMSNAQSLWVQAELHFQLALTYHDLGDEAKVKAEEQLQKVDTLLDVWCAESKFSQKLVLAPHLNIRWLRLRLMRPDTQLDNYQQSMELLQDMESCGHLRTTSCYGIAIEAARELSLRQGQPQIYQSFLELHQRLELYQEKVLGDLVDLLINHHQMLSEALKNGVDLRKALEWVDGFLEEYPSFSIPSLLHNLHRLRVEILKELGGSQKSIAQSLEVMGSLKKSLPNRHGPLVGVRPATVSISAYTDAQQAGDKSSGEKMHCPHLESDNFWVDWRDTHLDRIKQVETAMRLLSQWMAQDLQEGILSLDSAMDLIDASEEMKQAAANKNISEVSKAFSALTNNDLFISLYFQPPNGQGSGPREPRQQEGAPEEPASPQHVCARSWETLYTGLSKWLDMPSKSTVNNRQSLRLVLQDIRIHTVQDKKCHGNWVILECERAIRTLAQLNQPVQQYFSMHLLHWHMTIVNTCCEICYEFEEMLMDEALDYLGKAEEHNIKATEGYLRDNHAVLVAFCQRNMAQICLLKLHRAVMQQVDTESRTQLRDKGLQFLSEADQCFDRVELESSWSGGLEALNSRQHVTKSHVNWLSTQIALHLLREGNPDPDVAVRAEMWEWVQKAKAQALASTMGLNRESPPSMLKKIEESEIYSNLYSKMLEMRESISQANPRDRYHLRLALDNHVEKMRTYEPLRKIVEIREGKPLTTADLEDIVDGTDGRVIFVDWFHLPGLHAKPQLLMFTATAGSAPTVDTLSTTYEEVRDWIADYLDKQKTSDDQALLPLSEITIRQSCIPRLSSVVEPLSKRSQPGDILLLCPTSILHRVPLHALDVVDVVHGIEMPNALIHRNPIMYSHSHSLLRLSFWASKSAAESGLPINAIFMNGASHDKGQPLPEYQEGLRVIRDLSSQFSSTPALRTTTATKAALISSLPTTRLLHIQTHCGWDSANPLEHCIVCPEQPPPPPDSAYEDSPSTPSSRRLTAREIFSFQDGLQPGAHINLLVCSGALSALSPGDEALGLIPALLYSGAASTVSTLWATFDNDAAEFGKAFFRELSAECRRLGFEGEEMGKWIDLVRVVQRAVIRMDENQTKTLMAWAGFVMHGFWRMWIGREEGRKFCRVS